MKVNILFGEKKMKVFGPGNFFFLNTPKSCINLVGSQDASPPEPRHNPPSASRPSGLLRSHGDALCLRSPRCRTALGLRAT